MIRALIYGFATFCLGFTIVQSAVLLVYGALSGRLMRDKRAGRRAIALDKAETDPSMPGVSIIMPAYNEENVIAHTTVSALSQRYPNVEVVVVNDGSKDGTMQALIDQFDLELYEADPPPGPLETKPVLGIYRSRRERRIVVVDKAPSGAKADGSNAGINVASHPWVVVMDADEFLERDALARCMAEAVRSPDSVVAIGGTLLPANDIVIDGPDIVERHVPGNYWVGCQLIEYLTAFLVARPGLARVDAMPIVSGGFGLYRRDAVIAADGYQHGHLGEDMDMCLRVQRQEADAGRPFEVVQVPESVCWTEFPPTHAVLRRQRIRWHRGLRQVLGEHRSMIGRRRYGTVGSLGVSNLLVFEWIGPLLEAIGWLLLAVLLGLGWASPLGVATVFLATQLFGMISTTIGVAMMAKYVPAFTSRRDILRLIGWSCAVNWGYRQLTLWWRIRSLFPGSTGWGEMPRAGFRSATAPAPVPTSAA